MFSRANGETDLSDLLPVQQAPPAPAWFVPEPLPAPPPRRDPPPPDPHRMTENPEVTLKVATLPGSTIRAELREYLRRGFLTSVRGVTRMTKDR